MKRFVILVLLICICIMPHCVGEETADWSVAPVITKAYEQSAEKLYLEWTGSAPVYQVYLDGKSVASVSVQNAVIPIKNGSHIIAVYPIYAKKKADTNLDFELKVSGVPEVGDIGGNITVDLAALGLDPKELTYGMPSESLNIDYTADPIFNAAPEKLAAETDQDDIVYLSFTDRQNADEYLVTVKVGRDENHVRFYPEPDGSDQLITKANTMTTLKLDPDHLRQQGCMVPELNEKYTFTVQLRKYAVNLTNGEKEKTVIHESKASKGFDYTPVALWKTAPVITYASQTADGQITIRWDHDAAGRECEYTVMKINKALGIKTGEEAWGTTKENAFVINDVMNGSYTFTVVPGYGNETGSASAEASVDVKNEWVAAPTLTCEQGESGQVKLTWIAPAGVENYHITVYAGNSDSLLRFVDMDYKQFGEIDVTAAEGAMEYIYTYTGEYNAEVGQKLKFEIYGIRHAADGAEQRSASSAQVITIK